MFKIRTRYIVLMIGISVAIFLIVISQNYLFFNFPISTTAGGIGDHYSVDNIVISGLKKSYAIGERIDFAITVTGKLARCGDSPFVRIQDQNQSVVWSYQRPDLVLCRANDEIILVHQINSEDSANGSPIIKKIGSYELVASDMNMMTVKKEFVMTS
jgi:hypothetical protein